MINCKYFEVCGGCPLRNLTEDEYRRQKTEAFSAVMRDIKQDDLPVSDTVFIKDGLRRRAEPAFIYRKGRLVLGFNAAQSHEIFDMSSCPALLPVINDFLPALKEFLAAFCAVKQNIKVKNKLKTVSVTEGSVFITAADNGLDLLLCVNGSLQLEHRLIVSEFINKIPGIARISARDEKGRAETLAQNAEPYIYAGKTPVFIPAGTFLQASAEGQRALTDIVMSYADGRSGNIADLFCGCGTFSYPLAENIKNKITAVDSSDELLESFKHTVNRQAIPNIKIVRRNLFKYPLEGAELKDFDLVLFDPPRAGAKAQAEKISALPAADKPQTVIAISCNPHTFVNDANTLISGGYKIKNITPVDQFVCTRHTELTALFEKQ